VRFDRRLEDRDRVLQPAGVQEADAEPRRRELVRRIERQDGLIDLEGFVGAELVAEGERAGE
jgi:hypothetical protein